MKEKLYTKHTTRVSWRQGITTKYLCPTNHRGARIKVTAQAGSITVPWDYALNTSDNHAIAAGQLALKWGWEGEYVGAQMANGGYTFVDVSK